MVLNLNDAANVSGLLGCAFLLILWVAASRKLLGFLLIAGGCGLIIAMLRSNREPGTLAGLLLLGVLLQILLVTLYAMVRASQARSRSYRMAPTRRVISGKHRR